MRLVDSHCHLHMLDLSQHQQDLAVLLAQSAEQGVNTVLTVAVDVASSEQTIAIAERYSQVYASVGIHPSESVQIPVDWDYVAELAQHPRVIAIGETGLDYYYNKTGLVEQREYFRQHIRLARKVQKPLIIHTRSAHEDTIKILAEEQAQTVKGVMHCFTESWQMAEQALALGFYISFSGIITFKNAGDIVDVARQVPLERILIETDAPYLTPVPFRGKPNLPHYVRYVAEKIAEVKQISCAEVAEQTSLNFARLFNVR